jgi:hypothetical protein
VRDDLKAGDLVRIYDGLGDPDVTYYPLGIFVKYSEMYSNGRYKIAKVWVNGAEYGFDRPYWELEKMNEGR